jgi:hypothetical protein
VGESVGHLLHWVGVIGSRIWDDTLYFIFFFFSVALGLDMRVLADIHYIASRIYSISIMLVSKMFKQLYNNHGRLTFPQFSRHV